MEKSFTLVKQHHDLVAVILCQILSKCCVLGKFKVDSSSALGQLWITRSPLCPLLSVLAWQQLLRGLGSPQGQK